jgi:TatD DNase family protein
MLVDTHCHIHDATYPLDVADVLLHAKEADVEKMICVGTDDKSSNEAYFLAQKHANVYFSIGIHPHEVNRNTNGGDASMNVSYLGGLMSDAYTKGYGSKLVAVGEIGLDYFYEHATREKQIEVLRDQINLALENDLPIIFHVREAFDDFWPIFDSFNGPMRGVLHSFTDSAKNMRAAIARGLYIGVNGISTFTKDEQQKEMFASIPLNKLLLETDAPFLTPSPLRGKVNEPAFVRQVAEHHARIRGLSPDEVATQTSANAHALFAL